MYEYYQLTQKAGLPLFECFAEQNLPQTQKKPYEYICLKSKCTNIINLLKKQLYRFLSVLQSKTCRKRLQSPMSIFA
jgi:hypothetical protein